MRMLVPEFKLNGMASVRMSLEFSLFIPASNQCYPKHELEAILKQVDK